MNVRKYYTIKETIRGETYGKSGEPIDRVAAILRFYKLIYRLVG